MIGIYENDLGVRIEVFQTNTDVFGTNYVTWRWYNSGISYNVPLESFKVMIRVSHYRKISD